MNIALLIIAPLALTGRAPGSGSPATGSVGTHTGTTATASIY